MRQVRRQGAGLMRVLASPGRVAVIGASQDARKASGRPVRYLTEFGFGGEVLPISRRATEVGGLPAYASLSQLDAPIDVALVVVPRDAVIPALRDAEAAGAAVAIVIGSGFEDRSDAARQGLEEFMAQSPMRLIGPNCVGTVSVRSSSYLTFSSVLDQDRPMVGRVGMVTQSGALGNSLLQSLIKRDVGLAHWVSTGNEVDVGALEVVAGMLADPDVDAVGLFLEGLTDLEWLPEVESLLRATAKPLFVLKAARSAAGGAAAAGHTGRIVGSADASRAVLAELGAREVESVGALADALAVASVNPGLLGAPTPRIGVVTVSGAAGVLAADRIGRAPNLSLSSLTPDARRELAARVGAGTVIGNPLDIAVLDDTTAFTDAIGALADSGLCDLVIAVESGLAHDRSVLVRELGNVPVPVVVSSLSEDDRIPTDAVRLLGQLGVPYIPTVDRAVDAVSACAAATPVATPVATSTDHGPDGSAGAHVGLERAVALMPAEFPWSDWRVIDAESAAKVAVDLGIPLVVKAAGRTIEHRSELGAVAVVRTEAELGAVIARLEPIVAAEGDALVAQTFAEGFELMVSAVRDSELGPVAYVRLGGVLAERMSIQTVLWSGWDSDRRLRILTASRLGELLDGYRNGPRYDLGALNDVVSAALRVVEADLSMIELNPVILRERGVAVVDAVGRASEGTPVARPGDPTEGATQ